MKFTEAQLEVAIIELLAEQGYSYITGELTLPVDNNTKITAATEA